MAAPRIEVQLTLVGIQAVIWYLVIFRLLPPYVGGVINSMRTKERFLDNCAKAFKKMFMLDFAGDRELLFEFAVGFYGAIVQHLLGGLLCLPSVLGYGSELPTMASAFACHGALCEVGCEIQDFLVRMKEIALDGERGRKKNPASFLLSAISHHTIAQCLVLPLNLYYRNNAYYHEAVFLLQAANVVAIVCQAYGFTLDTSRPAERRQMKMVVTIGFLVALWSRLLRYSYIECALIATFIADGNIFVLKLAMVPLIFGSVFNILVLADFYRKFAKFVLARSSEVEYSTRWCEDSAVAAQAVPPGVQALQARGAKKEA